MHYPGRRLPLEVHVGARGEPLPLSVSHLRPDLIVLIGGRRLGEGFEFQREISFAGNGKPWENDELLSILCGLNSNDVPFIHQPKAMGSPDQLMRWWQEIGKLTRAFREIAWAAPDQWKASTIEPPVVGVRGWTGPKPFGF